MPNAWNYSAHELWHHNCGKSWIGTYDLITRAQPGRTYLVAAPTYPMLTDSSFRPFLDVARTLGVLNPNRLKK